MATILRDDLVRKIREQFESGEIFLVPAARATPEDEPYEPLSGSFERSHPLVDPETVRRCFDARRRMIAELRAEGRWSRGQSKPARRA